MDMEIEASELQPVSSDGSTGLTEKFPDSVDWAEFKERTIRQVMNSHIGRTPADYFMADLAVSFWMKHFDKTPTEMEELLRSTPLPPLQEPDEGLISVIDTSNEYPSAPALESAPSLVIPPTEPPARSYKDALLTNLENGSHEGEGDASDGPGGTSGEHRSVPPGPQEA